MPHLVLQYSANLRPPIDFHGLFQSLHEKLSAVGDVSIKHFKSRAQRLDDVLIGDGAPGRGFVHLDISLLTRPNDVRAAMAEAAAAVLTAWLAPALSELDADVTVHVHNLDPQIYRKVAVARRAAAMSA